MVNFNVGIERIEVNQTPDAVLEVSLDVHLLYVE